MATFKKLKSGKWQAQVARQGVRKSKSFHTKLEARDWAAQEEYQISQTEQSSTGEKLAVAFDRYAREVSIKKKGARWEIIRLEKLSEDKIAEKRMDELTPSDFADWRDRRLTNVSGSTVIREMNLISHILRVAEQEWGWLKSNPLRMVSRPKSNPPRTRLVTSSELERLKFVENYQDNGLCTTVSQRVILAFEFAIETAMRAGELRSLTWHDIDLEIQVARLLDTKNNDPRDVPLSSVAVQQLNCLPKNDDPNCFQLSASQLDSIFRKLRDKAGIQDLHFHDSRHEAVTRLSKKLDVLSLARVVGHRNIQQLMTYYNESAADLAKKLD